MESKKLQMQINPHKEPSVYAYLKKLEFEGHGEKGYENKKIIEIIRAWVNLMDLYDETDTIRLAMLLARGGASPAVADVHPAVEDDNDDDYMAVLNSARQRANQKRI